MAVYQIIYVIHFFFRALRTFSGVKGVSHSLIPIAFLMAFDIAGRGPLIFISPRVFAPYGPVGS